MFFGFIYFVAKENKDHRDCEADEKSDDADKPIEIIVRHTD